MGLGAELARVGGGEGTETTFNAKPNSNVWEQAGGWSEKSFIVLQMLGNSS